MLMLPEYPIRQRDFLLEISRAITAQLDLSEVLRRVLHASVVMTAAQMGVVALRNDADDSFTVRAYAGFSRELLSALNAKLGELMHEVGKGFDLEFLNSKLREMANLIDPALVQSVAIPLTFAETPLGLLIVFRSYQATATANDLQILQSFADQAAIAVHNAQLYGAISQERQRLAAILHHSGDGVMILSPSLTVLQVNRAFEFVTGWRAHEAVGRAQDEVIAWRGKEGDLLRDALQRGQFPNPPRGKEEESPTFYLEGDIVRKDGLTRGIGITYAPLFNAQAELVSLIANIRDITHMRRAQDMQNTFISTISHELRTPVALIKGYASTLAREDADWDIDTLRQSLAVIEDEADRLTELIDDLLTASKIQAERVVKLTLADVRLDLLGARAVERIRTQTQRHEFALSFQEGFPSIQGDARLLRQVVDNLLTNAIKYSPNGGTITVGGRYSEASVTFFVRDEGEGISEAEQAKVFDRFYRVENALAGKTKGTGLGLYLVKAIVEAHRGEIFVKSQPKQGATFYFILPRD